MSATTLVKDFLWRVSSALNDSAPQFTTWPEQELVHAINDGQNAILKYVPTACVRVDSFKLAQQSLQSIDDIPSANLVASDGSAIPAAGIKGRQLISLDCNMSGSGTGEGAAIRVTNRYDLDSVDPLWMTRTGATVREYTFNAAEQTKFRVSPRPLGASQWVRMTYAAYPTAIPAGGAIGSELYKFSGTSTATLSIDDINVDDLFWYVLARANMKDTVESKGQDVVMAVNAFTSSINAQATALTGINPNLKHLPMAQPEAPNADRT